jgi:hypothetical protein
MTKHTPGPWDHYGTPTIRAANGKLVAEIYDLDDTAEPKANLSLCTAAPEMADALRAIIFQVCQGKVLERDACITQARAALAKAEQP